MTALFTAQYILQGSYRKLSQEPMARLFGLLGSSHGGRSLVNDNVLDNIKAHQFRY